MPNTASKLVLFYFSLAGVFRQGRLPVMPDFAFAA